MKSDHRHELKTNELADWIGHFPQWFKDNTKTIVGVTAVVVLVIVVYGWNKYSGNVLVVRQRAAFTQEVAQLGGQKGRVYQDAMGGKDTSFLLHQSADNLATLASETSDPYMAAMALIKRAEALRA
jgi:predicted negative regulator of RcsB-dependent stress response